MVDLTVPTHPRVVGQLESSGAWVVRTGNDGLAYVTSGTRGFEVIDVADPSRPTRVGTGSTGRGVSALAVLDDHVAVVEETTSGTRMLSIVSVTDPTQPREVGSLPVEDRTDDLLWTGRYLYGAQGGRGIGVFDLSDRARPRLVGRTSLLQIALSLAADGDFLWVRDMWWIVQFQIGPELRWKGAGELELLGTPGSTYLLERRPTPGGGEWLPWAEVTPTEPVSVLPLPSSDEGTTHFFRAVIP